MIRSGRRDWCNSFLKSSLDRLAQGHESPNDWDPLRRPSTEFRLHHRITGKGHHLAVSNPNTLRRGSLVSMKWRSIDVFGLSVRFQFTKCFQITFPARCRSKEKDCGQPGEIQPDKSHPSKIKVQCLWSCGPRITHQLCSRNRAWQNLHFSRMKLATKREAQISALEGWKEVGNSTCGCLRHPEFLMALGWDRFQALNCILNRHLLFCGTQLMKLASSVNSKLGLIGSVHRNQSSAICKLNDCCWNKGLRELSQFTVSLAFV